MTPKNKISSSGRNCTEFVSDICWEPALWWASENSVVWLGRDKLSFTVKCKWRTERWQTSPCDLSVPVTKGKTTVNQGQLCQKTKESVCWMTHTLLRLEKVNRVELSLKMPSPSSSLSCNWHWEGYHDHVREKEERHWRERENNKADRYEDTAEVRWWNRDERKREMCVYRWIPAFYYRCTLSSKQMNPQYLSRSLNWASQTQKTSPRVLL